MSDGTQARPYEAPDRREWRDRVKASALSPSARLVALLMADYWPSNEGQPLWCAVKTLMEQSGLSRATVYRMFDELQEQRFLVKVEDATRYRSPRYVPARGLTVRRQGSHHETAGVSQGDPTPDVLHTDSDSGIEGIDHGPRVAAQPPAERAEHPLERVHPRPPRRRKTTPLTKAQRQQAWIEWQTMDLGDLEDDVQIRGNAFIEMEEQHGFRNPVAVAQKMIDRCEWDGFVAGFALGHNMEATITYGSSAA